MWKYFTNSTCTVTADPTESCTLGYYGVYVVLAEEAAHVKAGLDFAREHDLRLIIRNTGHDFIGRSTGWGALVINTHSFKDVEFLDAFEGPGDYSGPAVKIGAGVQGRELAGAVSEKGLAVVTGECPVSPAMRLVLVRGRTNRVDCWCRGRSDSGWRPRPSDNPLRNVYVAPPSEDETHLTARSRR